MHSSEDGGLLFTTGIGKAAVVAKRLAVSLTSVGVPAEWVHGTEWVHGDLGAARAGDAVIAVSHSGKTAELLQLAPHLQARDVALLAIVSDATSPLGAASAAALEARVPSADSGHGELLGSVPSRSIVAQEAICNGIVAEMVAARGCQPSDFKFHHPGGAIGIGVAPTST